MIVLKHNELDFASSGVTHSQIVFEKLFKNNILKNRGRSILGQSRIIREQTESERDAELAAEHAKLQKRYENGELAIEPLPLDDFIKINKLSLFVANDKLQKELKFERKLGRELAKNDEIKKNFEYHSVKKIHELERIQVNFRKQVFDFETMSYATSFLVLNAVIVDIDENLPANWCESAKKLGANCVIHSKTKKNSKQIFFVLEKPIKITSENQQDKLRLVQSFLNEIFNGDKSFGGHIAKNPLCHEFDNENNILCEHETEWFFNKLNHFNDLVHLAEQHFFGEIKENRKKERAANFKKNELETGVSRNCDTFNFLRVFAYEFTRKYGQKYAKIALAAHLREIIDNNPQITRGLAEREIRDIIKSIVGFCTTRYKATNTDKSIFFHHNRVKIMKNKELKEIISNRLDVKTKLTTEEKTALANELGVSLKTINNNIAKIRNEMKERSVPNNVKIHIWRTVVQPALEFSVIAEKLNVSESSARQMYSRFKRTFDESEQQKYVDLYNQKPVIFK